MDSLLTKLGDTLEAIAFFGLLAVIAAILVGVVGLAGVSTYLLGVTAIVVWGAVVVCFLITLYLIWFTK